VRAIQDLILKMLDKHKQQLSHHQKLHRYYRGENDYVANKQPAKSTDENHRVPVPWGNKIISVKLGYFLGGDAISYNSKVEGDKLLSEIEYSYHDWEEKHNAHLHKLAAIHGKSYELITLVDGEFECFAFSPLEMIVQLDGTKKKNVKLAVRKYSKEYDDVEYVDVITDSHIITYLYESDKNSLTEISRTQHIFSKCPVLLYENNSEQQGDFETTIPLIDRYSYIMSKNNDELSYLADAYFIIEGAKGTDTNKILEMKSNRVILTDAGNKAYFATKDLNGSFRKEVLDEIEKQIIQQSNIAILSTVQLSSNVSGVALRTKLQELENVTSMNEINLKELLFRRLRFFCEYLKVKRNKDHNPRNIIVEMSRNLPSNLKELADIVQILKGSVSLQTLISQLPFVKDVALEITRLEKETGQDLSPEEIKKLLESHLPNEEE